MEFDALDGNLLTSAEVAPRFANFGNRLGAALLDFLCTLPLGGLAFYFTMFAPSWTNYAIVAVLSFLYKPLMEGQFGATLGKMILKLKVVQQGGAKITMVQAFTRALPWLIASVLGLWASHDLLTYPGIEDVDGFAEYGELMAEYQQEMGFSAKSIISSIAGWLPLVSALFMLGSARKQALHDQLAETFVVHKDPLPQTF